MKNRCSQRHFYIRALRMLVPIPDLDISLTRYRVISIFPLKNLHRFPLVPLGVFFGLDSTWISPPKFPSDLLKYYFG